MHTTLRTFLAGAVACAGLAFAPLTAPAAAASTTNPYTASGVCGSGFTEINKRSGKGYVTHLMYSGRTGENCVVTLKTTKVGTPSYVYAALARQQPFDAVEDGRSTYRYYAGPVKLKAAGTCVRWGGGTHDDNFWTGWQHCG
ncbi:hypothetical protein HNR23_000500 [Nocardiopsis mwathae]|uniref:Spore-associated protein A n=1 Tax=Nocardiopsis mwathae TaxID=1472723 RepID=A0A7W9YE08_9ACTN|nr:serine/threonine protein kinase [Nocardiopsis mwathae]MBB6170440.1 hypothetical protein [Nocardiopsis mwathae]